MLNHIKADLYRIILRKGFILLTIILTALTVLAVVGLSSKFSVETVISTYPSVSFLIYLFISVLINDYTFREELQLKVLKNDMTTGVPRNALYTAKYLSGVILTVGLLLIISLATGVAAAFLISPTRGLEFAKGLFSLPQLLMMLQVFFCLGLFQLIGLFVQKTVLMLLICAVLQQTVKSIGDSVPVIQDIMSQLNSGSLVSFLLTAIAIVVIVFAGSELFNKKEL
jgi:hypothetical protein